MLFFSISLRQNYGKNIYELLKQTIKYNEPINLSTKDGNVFIISKEDYNNLMETLYISSIPELKKDIIKGLKKTIENCIEEDDVKW